MSAPTMVTEREAVMRERKAYKAGRSDIVTKGMLAMKADVEALAAERYPLPKVTRPREVSYGARWFKVVDGEVHCRPMHSSPEQQAEWISAAQVDFIVNREFITMCADLLANPTVEVDA